MTWAGGQGGVGATGALVGAARSASKADNWYNCSMRVTRIVVGGLLAVALAGCAGADVGTAPAHDSHPSNSAGAPTVLPSAGELQTGCGDSTGDTAPAAGAGGGRTDVAMVSDGDTVVLAYSFAGPVPTRGDLVLAVERDKQRRRHRVEQLGIKIHDGQPAGAYRRLVGRRAETAG